MKNAIITILIAYSLFSTRMVIEYDTINNYLQVTVDNLLRVCK